MNIRGNMFSNQGFQLRKISHQLTRLHFLLKTGKIKFIACQPEVAKTSDKEKGVYGLNYSINVIREKIWR